MAVDERQYVNDKGKLFKRYEILIELYRFVHENKTVPSERTLATRCKMPRGTLRVHLQRLLAEGLIGWCDGRLSVPDTTWEPPQEFVEFVF